MPPLRCRARVGPETMRVPRPPQGAVSAALGGRLRGSDRGRGPALQVRGLAADCVLAVPLHERRLSQRGFNQADLLARELRMKLSLDSARGALVRTRATPPQVGHDRMWRLENVRGAFAWRGPDLGGRSVMLVDDVATTGATLEACAAALRASGSGPVIGVSVARVIV